MAIHFKTSPDRKKHINAKYLKKDKVVAELLDQMQEIINRAIVEMVDHYVACGGVMEPRLSDMQQAGERFYRSAITHAYESAHQEKTLDQVGMTRLAGAGPLGLPRKIRSLSEIFHTRKYWQRIMKRNQKLTGRLQKQYKAKLEEAFRELMPMIDKNEITPAKAKKHMEKTFETSRSRVETIFRTESTTYFSKTQTAFFSGDDDIIGFMFDSVRDRVETDWCSSRHGLIYKPGSKLLRENTPACHWNCRSHLIALAKTNANLKLIEDPKRDPKRVKVIPLPKGWKK